MRTYWLRILLGAVAIYAIGMLGVFMFRRGKVKIDSVVSGSGPLSIPLPFVPFQLNGTRLGTIERVVVNRDAPKKVSSVDLQVKLEDSLVAQGLQGCRLAANVESDSTAKGNLNIHPGRIDERTFFYCAKDDSALVEFGEVTLNPGNITLPLLVPSSLAEELRSGQWVQTGHSGDSLAADSLAARAESLAGKAEWLGDSIADAQDLAAKKLRASQARQLGDSLRAEGLRRADSVRRALGRMADSLGGR